MENEEEVTGFFPNLENSRITKRGLGAKPLLESQIKDAQSTSRSAFEAARKLGISYNTYKKYAKLYGIFEDLKNPYGIGTFLLRNPISYGIRKAAAGNLKDYGVMYFRWYKEIHPWAMLEVYLLGFVITFTNVDKMASAADGLKTVEIIRKIYNNR